MTRRTPFTTTEPGTPPPAEKRARPSSAETPNDASIDDELATAVKAPADVAFDRPANPWTGPTDEAPGNVWNRPTADSAPPPLASIDASSPFTRESQGRLLIGQTIGSYRIVKRIGHGGMGVVFLAEHQMLASNAVVKFLHPELSVQSAVVERFFNEAKAATRIKHPGIIQIFDFGFHKETGSAFIVMEFLEGETMSARIERLRRLPAEAAMPLARQVASALSAAHKNGIVHRDLKPDNLYIVADPDLPEGERVKVLDFGIAKLIEAEPTRRTRTGDVFGTPLYMSPEQCRNAGDVDARTDIYALGCILYEMLVGHPPFVNEGLTQLITAHMFETPQPPRELVPTIPDPLEQVVLRALAKEPDGRQPSMSQFARDLDGIMGRRMSTPLPFSQDLSISAVSAPVARVPVSTTLGRSAGQLLDVHRPRRHFWTIMALAVGLAATITLVATQTGKDSSTKSVSRETEPKPAPIAAKSNVSSEPIVDPETATTSLPAAAQPEPPKKIPSKVLTKQQPVVTAPAAIEVETSAATSIVDAGVSVSPPAPTTGTLSLGSKPPCEIYVDGKPLGLRTPQTAIPLTPGAHKITLINTEFGIKDTFSIDIAAGERVRTSKDFTDKLKREAPSQSTTINPFEKK